MSQRVKRPNRSDDGSVPVKRRKRPTAQEEEEATSLASWRHINDLKIYNRTTTEAPAELFRKDLISAMKLPDSEPLASDEYWVIVDQWKQEWERGVQVPVNPDSLPEPSVTVTHCVPMSKALQEFKPPKSKYIRITKDDNFKLDDHVLSSAPAQAEAACSYDLDECDVAWLKIVNSERLAIGLNPITEDQLERVIERLELRCWDKIQAILRNEEGLGIEYDENVICDVCRSPDSEDGNEMVFCDSCNICVHQACYGIVTIPKGQWLCCTCLRPNPQSSPRPQCALCPSKGGAMKKTRSGHKWAHVSCALWIPEVSIGCVEKMEPITKISNIPQSRWALICVLCRERVGACIQCSVKTCKTAYHVTCAFKHGLEMRAIIEDETADDGVKLRSYCEKHSTSKYNKKEKSICSGSEDDDSKKKKRKDMTSEEKNQAMAARSQEIEAEFYKHVNPKDIAVHIEVDAEALQCIYSYWKLKRKAGHNKPLLPPKSEDIDMLSHKQEQADLEKMKMFVQLRQDLERVRNLCYMVSRREKLSRTFFRMREQTFHKQAAVLQSAVNLSPNIVEAVVEANHGPSIYDRLYSHCNAEDHSENFNSVLARIEGIKSPQDSSDEKKPEINGLYKNNPYRKLYFNGSGKRRTKGLYDSSLSSASSEEEKMKEKKESRLPSSSEDDKTFNKKKVSPSSKVKDRRKRKENCLSKPKIETSSEEDVKPPKKEWPTSRLKQIAKELGETGSDSDELMPIKSVAQPVSKKMSSIYSDSDSSDVSMRTEDKSASDSQSQSKLRTKAAVKEFSKPSTSKSPNKSSPENKKKVKEKEDPVSVKKDSKKKDYVPSDLIVPQRQAAKKATENLKSNTGARTVTTIPTKEQANVIVETELKPIKEKEKEEKEKEKPPSKPRKPGRPPKESKKEEPIKEEKVAKKESRKEKEDIEKELDKAELDLLAYVPQRQAAKKAAEHIKSGLGKPGAPEPQAGDQKEKEKVPEEKSSKKEPKKEVDIKPKEIEQKPKESPPAKISESKRKSSSTSSSSSSSSSSSYTSSSSSSESEDERPSKQPQSESTFSAREQTKRTGSSNDWPFLDKGAKSVASTSSSDSSDSSRPPSPQPKTIEQKEPPRPPKQQQQQPPVRTTPNKPSRKSTDKKSTPPEREEPSRPRGKGRPAKVKQRTSHASDRVGDANVWTGDISDSRSLEGDRSPRKARKGKPDDMEPKQKENKGANDKLQSPLREKEKVREVVTNKKQESAIIDLEKEILERKASNKVSNCRSESKSSEKTSRSPTKENKEPVKQKSPVKGKSIEDIFASKKVHTKSVPSPDHKPKKNNSHVIEEKREVIEEKLESFKPDLQNKLDEKEFHDKPMESRSIFSPNPKDMDLLSDFNTMLNDGFGMSKDDEIIKGPLTFTIGNSALFKEDSKEDSARETLNLVEKLRMGLSKKSTGYDIDDSVSVASSTKNDSDRLDFTEQIVPNTIIDHPILKDEVKEQPIQINLEMRDANYEDEKEYNKYVNTESNTPLEPEKNVPDIQHQHMDVTASADERWVPPSDNPYSINAAKKPFNEQSDMTSFISHYDTAQTKLGTQLEKDDDLKNNSPCLQDRRVTETPFLDAASMDCMSSPGPYSDIHPQAKWADSQVMPTRRSSSSSAASSTSNSSRRNDVDEDLMKRQEPIIMNHPAMDGMPFGMLPFPPSTLDPYPQYPEVSQFVGTPVSLFPPTSINTQIPFPSPGAAMFPPPFGASFPTPHSIIPPMSKPIDEAILFTPAACTAAFTSSQHNMELTAAMVVASAPKDDVIEEKLPEPVPSEPEPEPEPEPPEPEPPQPAAEPPPAPVQEEVPPSPALSNHVEPSPNPSLKSNSSAGKKSPSKPTRTSARFISQNQNKSPSKSPGKSPRQELKTSGRGRDGRKGAARGSTGRGQSQTRGRGRGRGRGRPQTHHEHDHHTTNTIHNKLVGTVYDLDFDDDDSEMGDLRAMRERRKSVDVHDKTKADMLHASRESSESPPPKFTSPNNKTRPFNTDLSELRPPTPIEKEASKPATPEPPPEETKTFPSIVPPVLPGPVDMRTYNSTFDAQYQDNLLGAFSTGATEQPANEELDEYFEKELQSALTGGLNKPVPQVPEVSNIKVSLSDSRNQLKVKIKGPFSSSSMAFSNNTSTVAPLPPSTDPITASLPLNTVASTVVTSIGTNLGASTSLRRMRKKELLRQYCSQDMNMDEPASNTGMTSVPATPINRTIITIPKAVASMTSIPTKDDYRDYRTDEFETKVRKEKNARPGLSRELRQLDIVPDDDNTLERRRSISSNNSNSGFETKRRGRPPRPLQTTPKLKIKISNNSIVGGNKIDEKKDRIRPPKKRLFSAIVKPSVEDLKRESMKFRKQVMANFDDQKKEKKKKDKTSKKSKKKKKQEVQIITNESTHTPKLIIRFGKKSVTDRTSNLDSESDKCKEVKKDAEMSNKDCERTESSSAGGASVNDDSAVKTSIPALSLSNKVTPIKLKLARCQEGSGYVMKTAAGKEKRLASSAAAAKQKSSESPAVIPVSASAVTTAKSSTATTLNLPDPAPPPVHTPTPLPLNKDCEVR